MLLQKISNLNPFWQRIISGSIFLIIFWSTFFISPIAFSILMFGVLLEILIFEWNKLFNPADKKFWLLMPIYPILPFLLIIYLNLIPECRRFLFIIFVLVFCFDSGSYVAGKLFGKTKIAPKISPGKTWEGFIGGLICVLLVTNLILMFLKQSWDLDLKILFSFAVSLFALFGDLFESYLKRRAGIKDTGNLMPGHGGLLDRFDSILFAVFLFFIL